MRRALLRGIGLALLSAPLRPLAQRLAKQDRIVILGRGSQSTTGEFVALLRLRLAELGHTDGQNLVIHALWDEGNQERLPSLAREAVAMKPDVIVTATTPGVRAARQATTTIPIVMFMVSDPVAEGFVTTLGRPGGNVTGVTNLALDLVPKTVELLGALVPKGAHIAALMSSNPALKAQLQSVMAAGKAYSFTFTPVIADSLDDIERGFVTMARLKVGGLIVLEDAVFFFHRARLAELAAQARLPAIYQYREHVEAGGLMSYGANVPNFLRLAAGFVDGILRGARPGEMPVRQPTEFEFAVNLKAAQALGIVMPPSLLLLADRVIQ